jgi:hypothetical protein
MQQPNLGYYIENDVESSHDSAGPKLHFSVASVILGVYVA